MTDDLGTGAKDVHAAASEVLRFWFDLTPQQHFAKSDALDAEISTRFASVVDDILKSHAHNRRDDPRRLLAAVIALDQFSRNMYRGTARAFAGDKLALELTLFAIDHGFEADMSAKERHFLYMPLMHSEDAEMQALSVDKFTALGDENTLKFAKDHAEVITRYGRYPSRNEALGRVSTDAGLPGAGGQGCGGNPGSRPGP